MSATLFPLPRPLSVGEVLDAGFRLFRGTVLACLPLAALAVIAGQLPSFYSVSRGRPPGAVTPDDPLWVAFNLCSALLTVLLVGAIILQQYRTGAGASRSLRLALAAALRRVPAVVGLVLLVMGAAIAAGLLAAVLGRAIGPAWAVLLFAVPFAWAAVSLLFAWPAILVEGRSVLGSLSASLELVRGHRLRTALVLLAALAALIVFHSLAVVLGVVTAALLGSADLAVVTAVTTVMLIVLGAFGVPFYTALILAAYEDLKIRRQGVDLERRIESIGQS